MNLSGSTIALDWDHFYLRMAVARARSASPKGPARVKVRKLLAEPIPAALNLDDPVAVGHFIRESLKKRRIRARRAIVAVARDQALLRMIRLPEAPDDELVSMAHLQMDKELPYPADEATIDVTFAHPSGSGSEQVGVLAAAVRTKLLANIRKTAEAAGLKLDRVGLRAYANFCLVTRCVPIKPGQRLIYVDVGPDFTEIDIFSGQNLLFSRSAFVKIPLDLSRPLHHASNEDRPPPDKAKLSAVLAELVLEVHRTVQAYRAEQAGLEDVSDEAPSAEPAEVILLGGGTGLEQDIARGLQERIDLPADILHPGQSFKLPRNINGDERMYSAVLGMALGPDTPEIIGPLNFLRPRRMKRPRTVGSTRRKVSAIAAGVLLCLGLMLGGRFRVGSVAREAANTEIAKNKLKAECKKMLRLRKKVQLVETWRRQGPGPLDEMRYITRMFPATNQAHLTKMLYFPGVRIDLKGRAKSSKVIDELTARLVEDNRFRVEPGSTAPVNDRYGFEQTFSLTLRPMKKSRTKDK